MGYDLHITRAPVWPENTGSEISREDWLEYVQSDPEITIDATGGTDLFIWKSPNEKTEGWLQWRDGNISVKNPDKPVIEKLLKIARVLSAEVQGDEGEVYNGTDEPPIYYEGDWVAVKQPGLLKLIISSRTFLVGISLIIVLAILYRWFNR